MVYKIQCGIRSFYPNQKQTPAILRRIFPNQYIHIFRSTFEFPITISGTRLCHFRYGKDAYDELLHIYLINCIFECGFSIMARLFWGKNYDRREIIN